MSSVNFPHQMNETNTTPLNFFSNYTKALSTLNIKCYWLTCTEGKQQTNYCNIHLFNYYIH